MAGADTTYKHPVTTAECRSATWKQQSGTQQSNPGSSVKTLLPRLAPANRDRQVAAIPAGAFLYRQPCNLPTRIDGACRLQLKGRACRNERVEVRRHSVHD